MAHHPLPSPSGNVSGEIVDPIQAVTEHILQGSENGTTLSNVSLECYQQLVERRLGLRYKPSFALHTIYTNVGAF